MDRTPMPSCQPPLDTVASLVERATLPCEDSGFCGLAVNDSVHRDVVTVVDSPLPVSTGEWLKAELSPKRGAPVEWPAGCAKKPLRTPIWPGAGATTP